jgi:hypothetical protein
MRLLLVLASVLVLAPLAVAGQAPLWKLDLSLQYWSGPSAYRATIVKQLSGLPVIAGKPVTLRLDRRSRCQTDTQGVVRPLGCGPALRALLAARGPGLEAIATGQFETSRSGAIGFRATAVRVVLPG